jgi:poly(3-hydroxybutyrate) depolymerase
MNSGKNDLLGGGAVLGFQTETLAGLRINAVKLIAVFASVDQTETRFHRDGAQPTREETESLQCNGQDSRIFLHVPPTRSGNCAKSRR